MIVSQQTTKLPAKAHPTDFNFAYEVIEEMKRLPLRSRVHFPTTNRGLQEAHVSCKLEYDRMDRPQATFSFSLPSHEFEMAHTAVVTCKVVDAKLMYHLFIRPNKRLRSNGQRGFNTTHPNANALAVAIGMNYIPGSTGRKIISVAKELEPA